MHVENWQPGDGIYVPQESWASRHPGPVTTDLRCPMKWDGKVPTDEECPESLSWLHTPRRIEDTADESAA